MPFIALAARLDDYAITKSKRLRTDANFVTNNAVLA
jgi:hypothetical protein